MKFTDLKIETQASHQRFFYQGRLFRQHDEFTCLTHFPRRRQCYDGGNFYQTRLRVSESPNMFKKILFPLVALFMLAGCANRQQLLKFPDDYTATAGSKPDGRHRKH